MADLLLIHSTICICCMLTSRIKLLERQLFKLEIFHFRDQCEVLLSVKDGSSDLSITILIKAVC